MIKVRGGTYKNRNLKEPPSEITRPSKDITKLGLFNILNLKLRNSIFLDLFSGSGNIAIEAYSRGAKEVYLNELNKISYKVIEENLNNLNILDIKKYNLDYLIFLKEMKNNNVKFDIIFLDPPYKLEINLDFIDELIANFLNEDGYLIIEREDKLKDDITSKYEFKEYKYGRSKLYKFIK